MSYSYSYSYNPDVLSALGTGAIVAIVLISIALCVLEIAGLRKIFAKAGEKGWKSIIPFVNVYVLFKITWGNGWMFLTEFIPFAGIVFSIITYHKLSKKFGHGVGYTLGLIFLNCVFVPILGFGSSQYDHDTQAAHTDTQATV